MATGTGYAPATLERSIRFYRVDAGQNDAGEPLTFSARDSLATLHELVEQGDRYASPPDGRVFSCWVDALNAPQRVRMATIRRSELPEVEDGGLLSPLNIPATSGLAEHVHLVFFTNQILGADFNFFGPRPSRFAWYHNEKTRGKHPPISVDPLLKADVAASLQRMRDVRVLRLKIRRAYVETIRAANSTLGRAFAAAAAAGDAEQVELVLAPRRYSRTESLKSDLLTAVRRLARRSDLTDGDVLAFHVRGENRDSGSIEEVDVLSSQVITRRRIVRLNERTRVLDPDSAYSEIRAAFGELREDIESASAISLG